MRLILATMITFLGYGITAALVPKYLEPIVVMAGTLVIGLTIAAWSDR
jgi:hypothetical protein